MRLRWRRAGQREVRNVAGDLGFGLIEHGLQSSAANRELHGDIPMIVLAVYGSGAEPLFNPGDLAQRDVSSSVRGPDQDLLNSLDVFPVSLLPADDGVITSLGPPSSS